MRPLLLLMTFLLSTHLLKAQDDCTDRFQKIVFPRLDFDGNVDYESWAKYNGGKPLRYDVYSPRNDTAELRPLIVLWHGGAFVDLIKKNSPDILRLAKDLAKAGYVVITPDYRGMVDLTGFGNEEEIIKVVVGSTLDANDAFCHIFSQIDNGNPYRIDKNQIFSGGVSAGAIIGLHGLLLNKTDQLGEKIAGYAREIDNGRIDDVLENKFCGNFNYIKAFFSVSGALIDTNLIEPTDMKFFHIHGTEDEFVAYNVGSPLWGLTAAPDLYGGKPIHEKMIEKGIDSEIMVYEGGGHVPYLNIDLESLAQDLTLINEKKYAECFNKILDFLFPMVNCEKKSPTPTGIKEYISNEVQVYPNPSNQIITVRIPQHLDGRLEILDISGKKISSQEWRGQSTVLNVQSLEDGMYLLQIVPSKSSEKTFIHKFIKNSSL